MIKLEYTFVSQFNVSWCEEFGKFKSFKSCLFLLLSGGSYIHRSLLIVMGPVCNYCGTRPDEATFRSLGNSSDVGDSSYVCQGFSCMESSDLRPWVISAQFFLKTCGWHLMYSEQTDFESVPLEQNFKWNSVPTYLFANLGEMVPNFILNFKNKRGNAVTFSEFQSP